jgi:hypothetical protein
MNSFFSASGSSPPRGRQPDTAGHDPHPEKHDGVSPLPEELVEALAALLAEALVNDIRQYPDRRDLTPDGAPVGRSVRSGHLSPTIRRSSPRLNQIQDSEVSPCVVRLSPSPSSVTSLAR